MNTALLVLIVELIKLL